MKYAAAFVLFAIFSSVPSFGQANPPDSQTLKDILTEVRGLHNDVRLSQTTQILLTELELQQNVVNRAMQKRDDLKSRVSQLQANQKDLTAKIAKFQEWADETLEPAQKKQLVESQEQYTADLADMNRKNVGIADDLAQAESALRKEQNTLQDIQGRLDDIVRKLQPVTP